MRASLRCKNMSVKGSSSPPSSVHSALNRHLAHHLADHQLAEPSLCSILNWISHEGDKHCWKMVSEKTSPCSKLYFFFSWTNSENLNINPSQLRLPKFLLLLNCMSNVLLWSQSSRQVLTYPGNNMSTARTSELATASQIPNRSI